MIIHLEHNGHKYRTDLNQPISIGITVKNGNQNPNCFWAEPVDISTITVGDFVGSVAQGGSTNYQRLSMTPHGNGTHTECFGHISSDPDATIDRCLTTHHFVAAVVTVPTSTLQNGDKVVLFEDYLKTVPKELPAAVILRTLPNDSDKLLRKYSGANPPYLESQIAQHLVENNVAHLLLDLPSVDREEDEGKLSAHNIFWQTQGKVRKSCTVTELIFVDDSVRDGYYLLNLQIPKIEIDAVPSHPVIYPLERC